MTQLNAMVQITKQLAWISSLDPSGHSNYPFAHIYQLHIDCWKYPHGDFYFYLFSMRFKKIKGEHTIHPVEPTIANTK